MEISSNTELLFQTIHSVNQFSIYEAVATWCEQFGLTEKEKGRDNLSVNDSVLTSVSPREVQLLVSPPTMACGNSLQENSLSFEALSNRTQFSKLCEDARFQHRVSARMYFRTRLDEDDGWERIVPLCWKNTFSRAHLESQVFAAIPGGTVFGPVLEVQIVKILGLPGLGISISSTLKHETTPQFVITRGTDRLVYENFGHKNELRSSAELISAFQKSEGREPCVEEGRSNALRKLVLLCPTRKLVQTISAILPVIPCSERQSFLRTKESG